VIRGVLKVHLVKVLRNVITIAEHNKTVRVQVRHVKQALEGLGMESYARLCGQTKTRDRKVGKNQIKVANGVTVKDCARKAPKACTADVNNKSAGRADKGDNTRYAMEVLQSQITCHMFPIKTFSLLVREVAQTYKNGLQFTPEAIDMIQTSAEAYLLDLIQKSAEILASRRARRLQPKDIQAVRNILDGN